MKILSECALCRLGIPARVPLCLRKGSPLACAFLHPITLKHFNKELRL